MIALQARSVHIGFVPADAADDEALVQRLTDVMNRAYAQAEVGLWRNGYLRTRFDEVAADTQRSRCDAGRAQRRLAAAYRSSRAIYIRLTRRQPRVRETMTRNPAKLAGPNPMPAPREIRVYTAAELDAITEELGTVEAAAVRFAAATGLRPAEWASVERRDVDKARRVLLVRGTKTYVHTARGAAHYGRARRPRDSAAAARQPLHVHDITEGAGAR